MASLITLREFAEKNNIKKPTVNARLKKLEKLNQDKKLTEKIDNVIYLTECGLAMLEKDFKDTPVKIPGKKKTRRRVKSQLLKDNELIKLYQEQIARLEKDLEASRHDNELLLSQINNLTSVISELTKSVSGALSESQKLISQEQSLALIDKAGGQEKLKEKKSKSLVSRIAVAGRVLWGL